MSVSIYWRAVNPGTFVGKFDMLERLEALFGTLPVTLKRADISTLEIASKLVCAEPFNQFINAIEMHGEIEVTKEY